jgi:hypothetical protein
VRGHDDHVASVVDRGINDFVGRGAAAHLDGNHVGWTMERGRNSIERCPARLIAPFAYRRYVGSVPRGPDHHWVLEHMNEMNRCVQTFRERGRVPYRSIGWLPEVRWQQNLSNRGRHADLMGERYAIRAPGFATRFRPCSACPVAAWRGLFPGSEDSRAYPPVYSLFTCWFTN